MDNQNIIKFLDDNAPGKPRILDHKSINFTYDYTFHTYTTPTHTMKAAALLTTLAATAAANHDYTVSDLVSGNFTVTNNDITMGK